MSGLDDITPGELRAMLREHAAVIEPGETLCVMVPPTWAPDDCKDLMASLNAVTPFPVLVFPGDAFGIIAPRDSWSPEQEEALKRAADIGAEIRARRERERHGER